MESGFKSIGAALKLAENREAAQGNKQPQAASHPAYAAVLQAIRGLPAYIESREAWAALAVTGASAVGHAPRAIVDAAAALIRGWRGDRAPLPSAVADKAAEIARAAAGPADAAVAELRRLQFAVSAARLTLKLATETRDAYAADPVLASRAAAGNGEAVDAAAARREAAVERGRAALGAAKVALAAHIAKIRETPGGLKLLAALPPPVKRGSI